MERTSKRRQGGTGETQLYWLEIERGYRHLRERERESVRVSCHNHRNGERERVRERTIENGSFLCFNSPYNHEDRQTRERETPTGPKEYCRRGSAAGNTRVRLFALHQIHAHANPNWQTHWVVTLHPLCPSNIVQDCSCILFCWDAEALFALSHIMCPFHCGQLTSLKNSHAMNMCFVWGLGFFFWEGANRVTEQDNVISCLPLTGAMQSAAGKVRKRTLLEDPFQFESREKRLNDHLSAK